MASKLLSLAALLVLPLLGHAQSNLRFVDARLLRFGFGTCTNASEFDTVIVVPTDRVWKIESVGVNQPSGTLQLDRTINLVTYQERFQAGTSVRYLERILPPYPLWIPPGSHQLTVTCGQRGFISVLEFVKVP